MGNRPCDHGRSASSPVVRDRNDRPPLLLLAMMHDTHRIGVIAKVVWGTQILHVVPLVYASAVAS